MWDAVINFINAHSWIDCWLIASLFYSCCSSIVSLVVRSVFMYHLAWDSWVRCEFAPTTILSKGHCGCLHRQTIEEHAWIGRGNVDEHCEDQRWKSVRRKQRRARTGLSESGKCMLVNAVWACACACACVCVGWARARKWIRRQSRKLRRSRWQRRKPQEVESGQFMSVNAMWAAMCMCMCRMGQSSKMDQKDRAASSEDQDGRGISLRR